MRFVKREGRNHKAAKTVVARWIRQAAKAGDWELSPNAKVFREWPILWNNPNKLWDVPPTYSHLKKRGLYVSAILDLCITDHEKIIAGIEICSWYSVPESKAEFLNTLPFPVCELDAGWVLSQKQRPQSWQMLASFGA